MKRRGVLPHSAHPIFDNKFLDSVNEADTMEEMAARKRKPNPPCRLTLILNHPLRTSVILGATSRLP